MQKGRTGNTATSAYDFMDEERFPINRLESAVIQALRTALLHRGDTEQTADFIDACTALEQRAYTSVKEAHVRWTGPEYQMSPPTVVEHGLTEIQEAMIRRLILVQYARYIYEETTGEEL